ncbi:hypothetical protein GBFDFA_04065 [Edwardsiella anguillarum]|nr:hypothetical protein QY76_16215 [Edwardsiella sp. EA181011]RFS99784.1 hypothetical protein CGL57_18220 [Edwardsiella anguillarum]GAJ66684.1 hypothetical protein MA13_contig00003-0020 [Edwardsiella piscicida]BET80019.1 hypothetical protein PBOPBF_04070 [Edwardsiella anguillarum]BET83307.1 hypothetical protein GHNJMD_04375 [Edwardsiella anguillarum]
MRANLNLVLNSYDCVSELECLSIEIDILMSEFIYANKIEKSALHEHIFLTYLLSIHHKITLLIQARKAEKRMDVV